MTAHLPEVTPPHEANQAVRFELTTLAKITPFLAQQKVTRFVAMEISTQLLGDTPELVGGERVVWSVPVLLTSPARGIVGKVGAIAVDANTGELLVNDDTVRRLTEDARHLAERSPL